MDSKYIGLLRSQQGHVSKKLYAIVCLMLITALLLTTVSFAWISISTAPEVTNISTTLGTNGNLEIALNTNGNTVTEFTAKEDMPIGINDAYSKNDYWGNVIDLRDERYGLQRVSLKPVGMNYTAGPPKVISTSAPFSVAQYATDGRITYVSSSCYLSNYDHVADRFPYSTNYGVRAVSEDLLPADTYAFAIDLLFRTNAEDANLLLQTTGIDRIYTEDNAPDNWNYSDLYEGVQGQGSRITIDNTDLLTAIRVAFVDTATGEIFGIAKADEDGYLHLDRADNSAVIRPMERNSIAPITAWIYLDGNIVANMHANVSSPASMKVNLQFSTDVTLYPMAGGNGESQTPTTPSAPTEPTESTEPTEPTESTEPTTPSAPTAPNEPTNPDPTTAPTTPNEYSGMDGNLHWEYTPEDKTLRITGSGAMLNHSSSSPAPWYNLRNKINHIIIDDRVTHIGSYAFYDHNRALDITLPAQLKTIGQRAFMYCNELTSLSFPAGITDISDMAFYDCTSLTDVYVNDLTAWCNISFAHYASNPLYSATNLYVNGVLTTDLVIPNDITTIKAFTFYNFEHLTSVTIPASVTSIEYPAFTDCDALTGIEVAPSNAYFCSVDGVLFNKDKTSLIQYPIGNSRSAYTIPDGVTTICQRAFASSSLTTVTFPASVAAMESHAFAFSDNLTNVHISDIGAWCNIVFEDAPANPLGYAENLYLNGELVTDLVIPEGVTAIRNYAFNNCPSLQSVTIPTSVTSIGYNAFQNCDTLTAVRIGSTADSTQVATIGVSAFENCSALRTVTIGNNITTIQNSAFRSCEFLSSLTLGNRVSYIGEYAFNGCTDLTSVSIPASVTQIGFCAFYTCPNLTDVYITDMAAWCKIYFDKGLSNNLLDGKNLYLNGELVTDLVIPEGVTSISQYAFRAFTNLKSVTIPTSVTSIGQLAFHNCPNLTDVYFEGSPSQWLTIAISDDNEGLTNATIHYAVEE